ncbi:MAG: class I SAM-dependent methyltransferase [Nitrospirota bacterium]
MRRPVRQRGVVARSAGQFFTQYDRVGRTYTKAKRSGPPLDYRLAFRARLPRSLKGKRALDAGCGYGPDLADLARRGAEVYGIDPSPTMIELARRLSPAFANLSVQRVRRTNFPDRFFDLVISIYAFHNEPNLKPAFREVHRILKPGGLFLYVVQHPLFVFQAKPTKVYHEQEVFRFDIPKAFPPVKISQPSHTLSEYFNDFVLSRFDVLDFAESRDPLPPWFLVKLRKRASGRR